MSFIIIDNKKKVGHGPFSTEEIASTWGDVFFDHIDWNIIPFKSIDYIEFSEKR